MTDRNATWKVGAHDSGLTFIVYNTTVRCHHPDRYVRNNSGRRTFFQTRAKAERVAASLNG